MAPVDDSDVRLEVVQALERRRRDESGSRASVLARPDDDQVVLRARPAQKRVDVGTADAGLDIADERFGEVGQHPLGAAAVPAIIAWRQIGGQTGDVLGAIQQIGEIGGWIVLLALTSA